MASAYRIDIRRWIIAVLMTFVALGSSQALAHGNMGSSGHGPGRAVSEASFYAAVVQAQEDQCCHDEEACTIVVSCHSPCIGLCPRPLRGLALAPHPGEPMPAADQIGDVADPFALERPPKF